MGGGNPISSLYYFTSYLGRSGQDWSPTAKAIHLGGSTCFLARAVNSLNDLPANNYEAIVNNPLLKSLSQMRLLVKL